MAIWSNGDPFGRCMGAGCPPKGYGDLAVRSAMVASLLRTTACWASSCRTACCSGAGQLYPRGARLPEGRHHRRGDRTGAQSLRRRGHPRRDPDRAEATGSWKGKGHGQQRRRHLPVFRAAHELPEGRERQHIRRAPSIDFDGHRSSPASCQSADRGWWTTASTSTSAAMSETGAGH